jgi:hypothetical protein
MRQYLYSQNEAIFRYILGKHSELLKNMPDTPVSFEKTKLYELQIDNK